jgi:hypothetical protein
MTSQIFKLELPAEILFNLLEAICSKNDKCYIFNHDSYKKGMYFNIIAPFLEECREYYHISKRAYLDRKLTYNSFTTIIRQICKFKQLKYTSQIKYDKSNYDIIYYIMQPDK